MRAAHSVGEPVKTYAEILRDNPHLQHKGGLAQLAAPGVMDELLGFKPPRERMH